MFFSDRGGDAALKQMNAQLYPHPPLVFKSSGTHLWIRALARNDRPGTTTKLHMAPYWNCYESGVVCTGTMNIPRDKSVAAIAAWEQSFFQSEFTHAAGVRKHTSFPGGVLAMWRSLQGKKTFPTKYLVEQNQTLGEFVTNHDHSYHNAPA
jgi:PRTRC genetic system protein B